MSTDNNDYKNLFRAQEKELLEEFFSFLRFQSISADPTKRPELQSCAAWLEKKLIESGFQVELWDKKETPIVFATHTDAGSSKPTLLLYNHYDVQPVDPLNLWHSDPFAPRKEGNLVYARGAQDNKGQCFYVLTALTLYLKKNKKFPINIKWIVEGEEESGSTGLAKILKEKSKELESDYLMVVDLGMRKSDLPAITLGTRGLTSMEIDVQGPKSDLHSGSNGGLSYNPIHAITALLSSLRDERGTIKVPGFYDTVITPKTEEISKINFDFNVQEFEEHTGQPPTGGEQKFSPLERAWLRPTIEINGIGGGYQGPGGKTIIPAHAHAKISCRLVPNQDPKEIAALIKKYLESQAPSGVQVKVTIHDGMGKPVRTNIDSKIVKALEAACTEVWGKEPEYILEGASIPIVSELSETIDTEIALFGLGLQTDNIHSPNECFGWDRIEKGFLTICKTIDLLAT
ncbi:MAG: cNDP2 [Chlamydiia bacterium]|nr:cNDP2 [Chlamydiia bacterium]